MPQWASHIPIGWQEERVEFRFAENSWQNHAGTEPGLILNYPNPGQFVVALSTEIDPFLLTGEPRIRGKPPSCQTMTPRTAG